MPALEALVRSSHRVVAVYTQPDRPAGRGQQLAASAVKQCALRHALPVEQPATLREPAAVERLQRWSADVMVVAAYGLLLPQSVLQTPRLGCINIHASLLPRWRGAAPIQRAIAAGDAESGVTIMQMEAGLDTGPMLLDARGADSVRAKPQRACTTGSPRSVRRRCSTRSTRLRRAQRRRACSRQKVSTYAAKIAQGGSSDRLVAFRCGDRPADSRVQSVARSRRRAGTVSNCASGRQCRSIRPSPAAPAKCSRTSAAGIDVGTGNGVLRLTRVQIAGRKAMSAAEFLNAHRLDGAVLGS